LVSGAQRAATEHLGFAGLIVRLLGRPHRLLPALSPNELTLLEEGRHTVLVSGDTVDSGRRDKALVDDILRELRQAADKWEELVADAERITYTVDLGDIYATANSDGKLVELKLAPRVMSDYSHGELADRLNMAFGALREEAETDNAQRYGGRLH
jgi:hypothetical protein